MLFDETGFLMLNDKNAQVPDMKKLIKEENHALTFDYTQAELDGALQPWALHNGWSTWQCVPIIGMMLSFVLFVAMPFSVRYSSIPYAAMIAIGVLSALVSLLGIVVTWKSEKRYADVCSFTVISRRNIICSVIVKLAMLFIVSGLIAKMTAFGDIVSVFFTIITSYIVYISFSSSAIAYAGRMSNMYIWSISTTTVHTLLQLIPALDIIDSVLLFFNGKAEEKPMLVDETSDIEFASDIW